MNNIIVMFLILVNIIIWSSAY